MYVQVLHSHIKMQFRQCPDGGEQLKQVMRSRPFACFLYLHLSF